VSLSGKSQIIPTLKAVLGMSPMMESGMTPPNAGKKYLLEVLTAGELQSLMGRARLDPRAASGRLDGPRHGWPEGLELEAAR
jgi:hypothetical protein